MTDKKISQLSNITGAELADSDEFVVARASTSENFAVTKAELYGSLPPANLSYSDLVASTEYTYSTGSAYSVVAGDVIGTTDGGVWEVAASGASDHHATTAGGVKLYEAGPDFSTRARAVAAHARNVAAGRSVPAGTVWSWPDAAIFFMPTGHALYGTDPIADLPGFAPYGELNAFHFGVVEGSGLSAGELTANTAAFNAFAAYKGRGKVSAGTYEVNGPIVFQAVTATPETSVSPAGFYGEGGSVGTTIVQTDLTKDLIQVIDADNNQYKFRPTFRDLNLVYNTGSATGSGGAAIRLRQVNAGHFENITIDSPDYGIYCERVVQSQFVGINLRTSKRSLGNRTSAFFVFDHDTVLEAGTSFGNTVIDCESQHPPSIGGVVRTFDLKAVDTLEINGGHYNGAQYHVYIAPDGTGGRTKVNDVTCNNVYWDQAPLNTTLIRTFYIAPSTTGTSQVFGIRQYGGKARGAEGTGANFFAFSQANATDYDGYDKFWEFHFSGIDLTGFDGAIINFLQHSSIDETAKIKGITICGNKFRDAGGGHASPNTNALVLCGTGVNVYGNTYIGNWADAGSNAILGDQDLDGLNLHGETFVTSRTATNIIISSLATNWRSYGHVSTAYSGEAGGPLEIVEQGSGSDGYYEVYSNGQMMTRKTVAFSSAAITTAFGGVYVTSSSQSTGNWERAFSATPTVIVSGRGTTGTAWCTQAGAPTTTASPSVLFMRGTSGTIDCEVKIVAWGDA